MLSLSFLRFINESQVRREVYRIWDIFSKLEMEIDEMDGEEADDFVYDVLSSLKLRVMAPLALYNKFKDLKIKYDNEIIEWDKALSLFSDTVDILIFESLDKKIHG